MRQNNLSSTISIVVKEIVRFYNLINFKRLKQKKKKLVSTYNTCVNISFCRAKYILSNLLVGFSDKYKV